MSDKRILLAGENALDVWVIGTCQRLSPEGPVPIQRPTKTSNNPGMAANVLANLRSLNPAVRVDFFSQSKPIYKIRHVDEASGAHLLRVDEGDDSTEDNVWQTIVDGMAKNKDGYSAFVYSDYAKGLLTAEVMKNLTDVAHEVGATVWCDTKKILGEWSQQIDFVKINEKEFHAHAAAGVSEPWKWCKNLIVTRGKDGADLYNFYGQIIYHTPSVSQKVFSIAGAGDTVLAALVTKYLETNDIKVSMDYSMTAAAVAVSKPGVVAVSREEIV